MYLDRLKTAFPFNSRVSDNDLYNWTAWPISFQLPEVSPKTTTSTLKFMVASIDLYFLQNCGRFMGLFDQCFFQHLVYKECFTFLIPLVIINDGTRGLKSVRLKVS